MKKRTVLMLMVFSLLLCSGAWGTDEFYGSSRTERAVRTERADRGERTYRTRRTDRPAREYKKQNVPADAAVEDKAVKEREMPVFKE